MNKIEVLILSIIIILFYACVNFTLTIKSEKSLLPFNLTLHGLYREST